MLIINRICLQSKQTIINAHRKCIRIGYGNNFCTNRLKVSTVNHDKIQWKENMSLPLFFNRNLEFQVFESHKFGYHPQQLTDIWTGFVKVANLSEKSASGTILKSFQIDGKSSTKQIGKITVFFSVINNKFLNMSISKQQQKNYLKNKLIIESMLLHFNGLPQYQQITGYCDLSTQQFCVSTSEVEVVSSQLMWNDEIIVQILQAELSKPVLVAIFLNKNRKYTTQIKLGSIKQGKKQVKMKKLKIKDNDGKISGYGLIDFRYEPIVNEKSKQTVHKTEANQSNIFENINDQSSGVQKYFKAHLLQLPKQEKQSQGKISRAFSRNQLQHTKGTEEFRLPSIGKIHNSESVPHLRKYSKDLKSVLNQQQNAYFHIFSIGQNHNDEPQKQKKLKPWEKSLKPYQIQKAMKNKKLKN